MTGIADRERPGGAPAGVGARRAWAAELAATLRLGWPLILTNLAQTAFTVTDVVLLGRLGPEAVAAGALGSNIYFGLLVFGMGVVLACAPMISEELGGNRHAVREVRRTVRQGFWAAATVSAPIGAVLWNTEALLLAMGQDPGLSASAGAYARALQWGVFPFLVYLVLRSFTAALERPLPALGVAAFGVGVNALLAYGLVFGAFGLPAWGVVGAGAASALANLAMAVGLGLVVVLDRRFRRYRIFGRFWRADGPRYRRLLALGLPIGATLAFETTIFNAAALLMGLIGRDALAAHAVAIQIAALCFMVPLGLSQAVTVRVGRAYGADDPGGVARAGWSALALCLAFMAGTALLIALAPRALVGLFLPLDDAGSRAVIELAVAYLAFAALFQVVDGAQAVGAGMLRGLQDTRVPMVYAAVGYWGVGLPLGYVLAFPLGLEGSGIWLGLAAGLAVVAALMIGRWSRRERLGLVRRSGPALQPAGE